MMKYITRRRVAMAAVIVALIWWLWPNNQMAKVEALQRDLANTELTREERQERFQELRKAMAGLTPEQRAQLGNRGQQRMQEQMSRYFQMTPAEKTAYLDQQINREQQMLQQAQNGASPKGNGPPGGGSGSGSGFGKGGGPRSDDDREKGRQKRLDATSPEFRAQMDQYRKDMAARRQQRGLPPSRFGG